MKKVIAFTLVTIIILGIIFRLFFGIFVIPPIGILPEGATIVYWRQGLNIPFISSVDGMLEQSGQGVSMLGRVLLYGALVEPIKERKIIKFGYSESFYLWSTSGYKYEK